MQGHTLSVGLAGGVASIVRDLDNARFAAAAAAAAAPLPLPWRSPDMATILSFNAASLSASLTATAAAEVAAVVCETSRS